MTTDEPSRPATDVLASLGAKLDELALTDDERTVLHELLVPDAEVAGFSLSSFGDLLPRIAGSAGSPEIFKDPGKLMGSAGSPDVFKDPGKLMGSAGSPDI